MHLVFGYSVWCEGKTNITDDSGNTLVDDYGNEIVQDYSGSDLDAKTHGTLTSADE